MSEWILPAAVAAGVPRGNLPGLQLALGDGVEGDETEEIEGRPHHPVETGFGETELGHELGPLVGFELGELELELGVDRKQTIVGLSFDERRDAPARRPRRRYWQCRAPVCRRSDLLS